MTGSPSAEAALVLRRLTYGATPVLQAEVATLGVAAFIEQQLMPDALDDGELDGLLSGFATLGATNKANVDKNLDELRHALALRALVSRRQLFEVMVDVWNNHFTVALEEDGRWRHLKISDEAEVARAHALGSFADLLTASAHSPAMLVYLDNYKSNAKSRSGINENYGRELLELHTLGIIDGQQVYTEEDVQGVGLVLSGWSVDTDDKVDTFRFRADYHHTGPVSILGGAWSTPGRADDAGYQDGVDLIAFLARHPSTARHLAYKLVRHFVADEPPPALVAAAAEVYLANDTAIVPVLRHIFASAEFAASTGMKVRKPFEHLLAVLRTLGSTVEAAADSNGAGSVRSLLSAAGHTPYAWPNPDGYPDTADAWVSSYGLLQRWNAAGRLAGNSINGIRSDLATLLPAPLPATAGELVDALAGRLLDNPLAEAERAAALVVPGKAAGDTTTGLDPANGLRSLVGVLLSSPSFQLR